MQKSNENEVGDEAGDTTDSKLMPSPSSMSLSPLVLNNRSTVFDLCTAEEDLPSKRIAQLWKAPLKLPGSRPSPKSPFGIGRGTPNRKKANSPSKLFTSDEEDSPYQIKRTFYQRSLSQPQPGPETPVNHPKRPKFDATNVAASPFDDGCMKRPALKPGNLKVASTNNLAPVVKKLFVKSQSDSKLIDADCNITKALEKIESNPNLIGDASRSYILPVMAKGKHQDLKEITGETLAALLHKKEDMLNISFKIIDCRYPYEFDGGHIQGALNLYTKKQIQVEFIDCKTDINNPDRKFPSGDGDIAKREILIFHCEFSSQRGPALCRYLRDIDRVANAMMYPYLFYPELYILYGGYKDFYQSYANLCQPQQYVPMEHPDYSAEFRKYKSVAKLGSSKKFCSKINL